MTLSICFNSSPSVQSFKSSPITWAVKISVAIVLMNTFAICQYTRQLFGLIFSIFWMYWVILKAKNDKRTHIIIPITDLMIKNLFLNPKMVSSPYARMKNGKIMQRATAKFTLIKNFSSFTYFFSRPVMESSILLCISMNSVEDLASMFF